VPIFLAGQFQMNAASIGTFMALDNIAALLIQPPVGAWSDRVNTPLGRRIPFILVGAPLAAAACGLIPLANALPLFLLSTITFLLSMAFWRTPFTALIADITPSPSRSQANGIINAIGVLGALLAFFGGAILYRQKPAYPFWAGASLLLLAVGFIAVLIKEPKRFAGKEAPASLLNNLLLILRDPDRSALRLFLAIFCWFVAYNAVEAFFTLYAKNHLLMNEADGTRLLGQLSLLFVIFSLPAGYLGSRIGRRVTISIGIAIMTLCMLSMFFFPVATLTTLVTTLPVLGAVPVIGLVLMVAGMAWAFININSLPMVVDMTTLARVGTYTGLYYLFSTLAAIAGPNINGWVIQLSGSDYSTTMIAAPIFMILAFILMMEVKRGEAVSQPLPAEGAPVS
jgi:MFS family permease